MARHRGTGTAVLFGGSLDFTSGNTYDDTWAWNGHDWLLDNRPIAGPVASVGDATLMEGEAGTRNAVFAVTLSELTSSQVVIDYATVDRTARGAPDGDDYVASSGSVTIPPGVTVTTVKVPVNG